MAIEVVNGHVNVNGKIKDKGAKLKMDEAEEKRLVRLGFAKFIEEEDIIEDVESSKEDNKKDDKKAGK